MENKFEFENYLKNNPLLKEVEEKVDEFEEGDVVKIHGDVVTDIAGGNVNGVIKDGPYENGEYTVLIGSRKMPKDIHGKFLRLNIFLTQDLLATPRNLKNYNGKPTTIKKGSEITVIQKRFDKQPNDGLIRYNGEEYVVTASKLEDELISFRKINKNKEL
jgi:hypothetical protein